jgi:hypothetical protein
MSRRVIEISVCFQSFQNFAGGSTRHRRDMEREPEARYLTLEIVSKVSVTKRLRYSSCIEAVDNVWLNFLALPSGRSVVTQEQQ